MKPLDEFWHELVVNGIGGRTVHEAKARMPYTEFLDWVAYKQMRGSLNTGMNLERGFGHLAFMLHRALGGSMRIHEFMPHFDNESTPQNVDELDFAAVAKLLGAVHRRE